MQSPGLELMLVVPLFAFLVPFAMYPTISVREHSGVTLTTLPRLVAYSDPQTQLPFTFLPMCQAAAGVDKRLRW